MTTAAQPAQHVTGTASSITAPEEFANGERISTAPAYPATPTLTARSG
ncbi:hypothetical protein KCP74_25225 [Salmonella enterica subsp. enterica]|nr:hypothetical protein KCP74_25225 [Salmonella enterica subsp. enterica]